MPRLRCAHDWQLETDWDGDPDVINGTRSWNVFRCRKCGNEREATREEVREYEAEEADRQADHWERHNDW